jgi:hypothetical protein
MTTKEEAEEITSELLDVFSEEVTTQQAGQYIGHWNELLLFLKDLPEGTEGGLGDDADTPTA